MIQPGDLIPLAQVAIELETSDRLDSLGQPGATDQAQDNERVDDATHDKNHMRR
jgi:hypothetical protein